MPNRIPRRGDWRRYISVKRGLMVVSSSGAAKLDWSAPTSVFSGHAGRTGIFGMERDTASKEVAEMQYRYELGYQSGAMPADRVYDGSQVFDILSIDIDQSTWTMKLLCRENLNG